MRIVTLRLAPYASRRVYARSTPTEERSRVEGMLAFCARRVADPRFRIFAFIQFPRMRTVTPALTQAEQKLEGVPQPFVSQKGARE
jgi:hypothetical protein